MKRVKKVLIAVLSLIMVASISFATGCFLLDSEDETSEVAIVMDKAVEKIDSISQLMFEAIDNANGQQANPLSSESNTVSPFSATEKENYYYDLGNSAYSLIVARQTYMNYPYNIVNYMMQNTTKAHKTYESKYKVGTTVYGEASKVIDQTLTEIFENPEMQRPILAIEVKKNKNVITFRADWDWRNEYLAENAPFYNAQILTNCRIEYNQSDKSIKKIMMNWAWTGINGIFMSALMDFEENQYYIVDVYNSDRYQITKDYSTIPTLFNTGKLDYEKLKEFDYEGINVIRTNITNDVNEIDYTAYKMEKSTYVYNWCNQIEESEFADFYDSIYKKVTTIPLRGEKDVMSLKNASKVDYMNDAAIYGFNTTAFVTNYNGTHFLYLSDEQLKTTLTDLLKVKEIKNKPENSAFINGALGSLERLKGRYVGELGEYNGKTYTLDYIFEGTNWQNGWEHQSQKFKYRITDGTNTLTFERKDDELFNAIINGVEIVDQQGEEVVRGLVYTLNEDGRSYSVSYIQDSSISKIEIPAYYLGYPITKMQGSFTGLEEITIPATIKKIYNFNAESNELKKVNFLGTVDEWAQIDFSSGFAYVRTPTSFANDLYIKGQLLTNANITVTKISDGAFINCRSLASVTLNEQVEYIGPNTFALSTSLGTKYNDGYYLGTQSNPYKIYLRSEANVQKPVLHQDTEILSGYAFINNRAIQEVELNAKLKSIGEWVFDRIREVTIPESVIELSGKVFGENQGINLTFEETEKEYTWYAVSMEFVPFFGSEQVDIRELGRNEKSIIITSAGNSAEKMIRYYYPEEE